MSPFKLATPQGPTLRIRENRAVGWIWRKGSASCILGTSEDSPSRNACIGIKGWEIPPPPSGKAKEQKRKPYKWIEISKISQRCNLFEKLLTQGQLGGSLAPNLQAEPTGGAGQGQMVDVKKRHQGCQVLAAYILFLLLLQPQSTGSPTLEPRTPPCTLPPSMREGQIIL